VLYSCQKLQMQFGSCSLWGYVRDHCLFSSSEGVFRGRCSERGIPKSREQFLKCHWGPITGRPSAHGCL